MTNSTPDPKEGQRIGEQNNEEIEVEEESNVEEHELEFRIEGKPHFADNKYLIENLNPRIDSIGHKTRRIG